MRGETLFRGRQLEQDHPIFQPDILIIADNRSANCLVRGVIAYSSASDSSAG